MGKGDLDLIYPFVPFDSLGGPPRVSTAAHPMSPALYGPFLAPFSPLSRPFLAPFSPLSRPFLAPSGLHACLQPFCHIFIIEGWLPTAMCRPTKFSIQFVIEGCCLPVGSFHTAIGQLWRVAKHLTFRTHMERPSRAIPLTRFRCLWWSTRLQGPIPI